MQVACPEHVELKACSFIRCGGSYIKLFDSQGGIRALGDCLFQCLGTLLEVHALLSLTSAMEP